MRAKYEKIEKMKMEKNVLLVLISTCALLSYVTTDHVGPDPWNLGDYDVMSKLQRDKDVPPDLKLPVKKKVEPESNLGYGEWFFRRILSIVLKGGQIKKNEDGSTEISLQMRIEEEQMKTLDGLLQSNTPLSEEMYRRSVGYVEEALYKPSFIDKIVMAWSDYVLIYLTDYRTEIIWTLGIASVASLLFWLWNHMSHKHLVMIVFMALYFYEVFVSYKDAEKQELDTFLAALNSCKWYKIWSSNCEVPKPDPVVFLKHMNPLKIALRMFTTLISEPMIILSDTLKTLVQGMTDGLWYPFDKILYGILIITFNVLLMFTLITILFNYIFNIPIDLGYLGVSLRLRQRNRSLFSHDSRRQSGRIEELSISSRSEDRLSGSNLQRVLDICARAFREPSSDSKNHIRIANSSNNVGLRRSASTGRLPNSSANVEVPALTEFRQRKKTRLDGSGDAP